MNIFDLKQRQLVCVTEHSDDCYFPNGSMLKKGHVYTLIWINLYPFKSYVFLKEFPNLEFNTVQFEEVKGYQQPEMQPSVEELMRLHRPYVVSGDKPQKETFKNKFFFRPRSCTPFLGIHERIQVYLETEGHTLKKIYSGDKLPRLECAGSAIIDLAEYERRLCALREGELFIIGSKNTSIKVDVLIKKSGISPLHCYVVRNRGQYEIYDISSQGTNIVK